MRDSVHCANSFGSSCCRFAFIGKSVRGKWMVFLRSSCAGTVIGGNSHRNRRRKWAHYSHATTLPAANRRRQKTIACATVESFEFIGKLPFSLNLSLWLAFQHSHASARTGLVFPSLGGITPLLEKRLISSG